MTTARDLVNELRAKGFKVTYRIRKDGGIRIKSIEGVKFSDSEGNNRARMILDKSLSEKQLAQRRGNQEKAKRGIKLAKKYKAKKLTKPQKRAIAKINRKIKKYGGKGRIGASLGKKIIKEEGLKGLKEKGNELIRKSLGLMNPNNVEGEASAILELGGEEAERVAKKLVNASYKMINEYFNEIQKLRYDIKKQGEFLLKTNGLSFNVEEDDEYTALRELNLARIDKLIELSVERFKNLK